MTVTLPVALVLALLIGAVLGGGMRLALGKRSHLGFSASVLSGIAGAVLGETVLAVIFGGDPSRTHPGVALAAAAAGTLVILLLATQLTRKPDPTPEALVAAGESNHVEFKSTARRNLRTGERDEKIELVIAKTVASLANSDGGWLVIGVADDGTVLGVDEDLPLMRQPDVDRYELWLRDYLTRTIGGAAASSLQVTFPSVSGREVCVVRVPRAVRPVFLVPSKADGPQLWVRVGNSTRQLPIDQALAYASDRFGKRKLSASPRF